MKKVFLALGLVAFTVSAQAAKPVPQPEPEPEPTPAVLYCDGTQVVDATGEIYHPLAEYTVTFHSTEPYVGDSVTVRNSVSPSDWEIWQKSPARYSLKRETQWGTRYMYIARGSLRFSHHSPTTGEAHTTLGDCTTETQF